MTRARWALSAVLLAAAAAWPVARASDTANPAAGPNWAMSAPSAWPADLVRFFARHAERPADDPQAVEADLLRQRAAAAMQVLSRNDVRLHRRAFDEAAADPTRAGDVRAAALGDAAAAARIGRSYRDDPRDAERGHGRYVGWLQYASLLGDEQASYELALHFRREAQPLLAAQYETLAIALGYRPPSALDHVRK
ncbi:MAG: hypothetical protein MUF03_08370 [Rubrivivax sp.]|jgi:hypothetical protein|nr:hypothetical protein [Rubrivivax sp.]